jgi:hypothetical protein
MGRVYTPLSKKSAPCVPPPPPRAGAPKSGASGATPTVAVATPSMMLSPFLIIFVPFAGRDWHSVDLARMLSMKYSDPPKLRGIISRTAANKTEGTDGRQIVSSQACGEIAQAPPQAKNTESTGGRGPAKRNPEKEQGIAHRGSIAALAARTEAETPRRRR